MPIRRKKNKRFKILLYAILICLASMTGLWIYEWIMLKKADYVRYDEFGIEIPTEYSIHGIDVSKYQRVIDWSSVKAMNVENIRIGFAFMKATEGNVNEDKYFKRNWKKARQAKMIRGAYHFFIPSKSGKTQAENFISTVDLEKGDLPPVLDVETLGRTKPEALRARVKEWLVVIENFYGVKPIIYTNAAFYQAHLEGAFDEYPLWVAHYHGKGKPRIYRDWHFWQYSETGRVDGILSKVDFNVFNGDSTEFSRMLLN